MVVKVAIIIYSTYGHIVQLAEAELKGIQQIPGIEATIFQLPETLPDEVLTAIHAAPKPDYPIITHDDLPKFDGFLFGLPTRYGSVPSQFSSFWDATGGLWAQGTLYGKYYGQFVSTGTPGGGQEVTVRNTISSFAHHGMIYVPLGYKHTFAEFSSFDTVHGGSPWGAGSFAAADGSRQPSEPEKDVATIQGKLFGEILIRAHGGIEAVQGGDQTAATGAVPAAIPEEPTPAAPAAAAATAPADGTPAAAAGAAGAPAAAAGASTARVAATTAEAPAEKAKSGSKCCIVM